VEAIECTPYDLEWLDNQLLPYGLGARDWQFCAPDSAGGLFPAAVNAHLVFRR